MSKVELFPKDMLKPPLQIPTVHKCLERLEHHITTEKKGLRDKLFKAGLPTDCGEVGRNMFIELTKFGCDESEVAMDLMVLTLYDVVVLIDDSHSMGADLQNIKTLKNTLKQICEIYELANPNGLKAVLFLNHNKETNNVKKGDVDGIVDCSLYKGVTRLGTELQRKVLTKFALGTKALGPVVMSKPLLVIALTDGVIEGERMGLLTKVILKCIETLILDDKKGKHAVAFQFVCIGNDPVAIKLLEFLDNHHYIWNYVDCLSANNGLDTIGEQEWEAIKWEVLPKLLVGALVSHWDEHERLEIEDVADIEILSQTSRNDEILDDD